MILRAFFLGLRGALTAPRLLFFLWLVLLAAAVPFGLLMQRQIADDIGASRAHVDLRQRMDMLWLDEFHHRSGELGDALQPVKVGRLDLLHDLDLLFSGRLFAQARGLVAAGCAYAAVWLLLLGGVIDRFARGGGRFVLSQFLAAGGRYYWRFLKLTAISALLYWLLYRVAAWAYGTLDRRLIDVTAESTILRDYLLLAVPLVVAALAVMLVFDYARIAAVLDEEPSSWRALRRGVRFVARRPWVVVGLTLLFGLCVAGLVALRATADPGVGEATALGVLGVFALGQLFILARLVLRLGLVGAELTLYRRLR